jgi:hypothetical protein
VPLLFQRGIFIKISHVYVVFYGDNRCFDLKRCDFDGSLLIDETVCYIVRFLF